MLTRLIVSCFKLIEALELDFDRGAFAITGETGAGKSSVVQALAAALGAKVQGNPLRPGASRGEVQAWFDLRDHPKVADWLEEAGFAAAELDGLQTQCVLRRTFVADGRSRAWINGSACPLSTLAEAGGQLADLVSQNQHHSLMRPQNQGQLLDSSWDSAQMLKRLAAGFRELGALDKAVAELEAESAGAEQEAEFVQYQLDSLRELQLGDGDFELLEAEYRRLASAGDLLTALDGVENLLRSTPDAALERLQKALQQLPKARGDEDPLQAIRQQLVEATTQIEEALQTGQQFARELEEHPGRLEELEKRLTACHELARRHRRAPNELWSLEAQWTERLQELQSVDDRLAELRRRRETARADWQRQAEEVGGQRQQAAAALQGEVGSLLGLLGMEGGRFEVRLTPAQASARGLERASFLYSPAAAVEPQDLGRIASGGELSRLYLALCLATLTLSGHPDSMSPVLVLDEVDTGIGGQTAHRLAGLIRRLGESRQLLCVTHLPQVAAAAHHHLRVMRSEGDLPRLEAQLLPNGERREELARMLGGGVAGTESRDLADQLLKWAIEADSVAASAS